jgi:hypothetical protein
MSKTQEIIVHTIILSLTIVGSFYLPTSFLARYDLWIAGILFLFLFIYKKFNIPFLTNSRIVEAVLFASTVMIIINTTGGMKSPFFFLLYFLLFALSLILEPFISVSVTFVLIALFLFSIPQNQNIKELFPILSLAFLTPFAMFMGEEYIKEQQERKRNDSLQKSLDVNKKETLKFVSLMLKNHVKTIHQSVDNFMGDHDLKKIKTSVVGLEKIIDEFEKSR